MFRYMVTYGTGGFAEPMVLMDPVQDKRLVDVQLNAKANEPATLTFTIDYSNLGYSTIEVMSGDVWLGYGEPSGNSITGSNNSRILFQGQIYEIKLNANGTKTVTCRDRMQRLADLKYNVFTAHRTARMASGRAPASLVISYLKEAMERYAWSGTLPIDTSKMGNIGSSESSGSQEKVIEFPAAKGASVLDMFVSNICNPYDESMFWDAQTQSFYIAKTPPEGTTWNSVTVTEDMATDVNVDTNVLDIYTAAYVEGGNAPMWYRNVSDGFYCTVARAGSRYDESITLTPVSSSLPVTNVSAGTVVNIDYGVWYEIEDDYLFRGGNNTTIRLKQYLQMDYPVGTSVYVSNKKSVFSPRRCNLYGFGTTSDPYVEPRARVIPMDATDHPHAATYEGISILADYNIIILKDLADRYGVRCMDVIDDTITHADLLFEVGWRQLIGQDAYKPSVNVKMIDPALVSDGSAAHMRVGCKVNFDLSEYGVEGDLMVTGMTINPNKPESNTYTFGSLRRTVTDLIRSSNLNADNSAYLARR